MFNFKPSLTLAAILLGAATAPAANIPVVTGFNAITIPTLISLNYSADNVFSTAQDGEAIYRWNGGTWSVFIYYADLPGWDPIAPVFLPGEGIFYFALGPQTFVANFHANLVGDASGSERGSAPYPNGALVQNRYYFQGSPTGQSASYEDIFEAAPNDETALFRFIPASPDINPTGGYYRIYHYKTGVWTPETPVMNPLEPVFVVYPYLSLKYTRTGNTIDFNWPRGQLEEADFPTGPWRNVTTSGNTYSVTPNPQTEQARYYHVRE